jgi:hypothetical protein
MAITVGTGITAKKVIVVGSTTQVKQVTVGTPVKRVTSGAFNIDTIDGVNTTGATTGSLLIYNSTLSKWVANKNLEEQIINGGSY